MLGPRFPVAHRDTCEPEFCERWLRLHASLARIGNTRSAAIFDIDETLIRRGGRGRVDDVCRLYELCLAIGITPFLITARTEDARAVTEQQLRTLRLDGYKRLFMHPELSKARLSRAAAAHEKARARARIEAHGYSICFNAGDAWSDHFDPIPHDVVVALGDERALLFVDEDGVAHLKLVPSEA